jgi:hypothetical protein
MQPQQRQIATYELGWNHLTNQPFVALQLQGGGNVQLQVNTADELNVLIAVLGRSPVFIRQDGLVFTGPISA